MPAARERSDAPSTKIGNLLSKTPEIVQPKPLSLKAPPALNERWLQSIIAEDPTILGLRDVIVKDIERRQP